MLIDFSINTEKAASDKEIVSVANAYFKADCADTLEIRVDGAPRVLAHDGKAWQLIE